VICEAEDEVWTMSGREGGDDGPLSCATLSAPQRVLLLKNTHKTPSLGYDARIHYVLDSVHLLDVVDRFRGIP
jgi:hypothetical protein